MDMIAANSTPDPDDSPALQRRHISVFCAAERPYRLPSLINTTSKTNDLYQMVLHPPVELARVFSNFPVGRLQVIGRLHSIWSSKLPGLGL
jgi:hypothetical protein